MTATKAANWRLWLQAPAFALVWTAAVFLSAGGFYWVRGWIYIGLFMAGVSVSGLIVRCFNPSLIAARAKWRHPDTKHFDKIFLSVYMPLNLLQPVVAGLDAERHRWSSMSFASVYPGVVLFTFGIALITWALAVNPFAESTVRIQTDRGQTVISAGPYRFVRHPIYVGGILMYVATPLILGSVWALAMGGVIAALFIWRTALEDKALQAELAGYQEYATLTRYRLLPKVW